MNNVPFAPAGHMHVHDHAARPDDVRSRRLAWAFALTSVTLAVEVVGGIWSGSLALLADAGHMLVDAMALLLAAVGAWVALRPADTRRSYGYGRMEVLVGFVNALIQLALVVWIIYEAVTRLWHPHAILPGIMLVVAAVGLLVNVFVLWMLHGHAGDDLNMAGAVLHVVGDLLGSLAAVVAALAIGLFGWLWADPALSIVVALLIASSAWRLLRRSTHILLEGVPDGMDSAEVERALRGADASICGVHHLHVWQLASGSRMATLHLQLQPAADPERAMQCVRETLRQGFNIRHVTVQIDAQDCPDEDHACGGGDVP